MLARAQRAAAEQAAQPDAHGRTRSGRSRPSALLVALRPSQVPVGHQLEPGSRRASPLLPSRPSTTLAGPTVSGVAQRTGGEPLDTGTRGFMEARLGQDFSGVRVHQDPTSSASAEALGARAYTVGDDIVVSRRAAAPGSREGRRTLAHELAHVVQQRRGGMPPKVEDRGRLEEAADRAAAQAMDGGGMVAVLGAAGPSFMCQPEEEERAAEAARRRAEKQETQQRRQERAAAGKDPATQSQAAAGHELRALEESYRQPGAKQRSVKRKAADLERFRSLLKRARGTVLEKNKRQGDFDELQRTPTSTAEKPQTKHVVGGPELPGQELRPGEDPYAQPDFSVWRRNKDGSVERLRVNLKSHNLRGLTPAQARATAKACVAQAISNSRHLATGDTIVISFAQTPTQEVQDVMKAELFGRGSPVGEVRFGTTTHRRQDFKAPAPPPKTKKTPQGPKAAKATKAPKTKAPKTKAAKAPQVTSPPKTTPPTIESPEAETTTPAQKPQPAAVAGRPAPVTGAAGPPIEETVPAVPTAQSASGHLGTPRPSTVPAPRSQMEAHPGTTVPEPTPTMDVHQGTTMPKPTFPMDVHEEPEPGAGFDPTATAEAANAAADLLTVILGPYIFPNAEEDYEKRIKELQDELQPTIETRISELLENETPRIAELGGSGNKLFITVTVAIWNQQSDVAGVPAIPSLQLDDVKLSTENINETEPSHSFWDAVRSTEFGRSREYQKYSIPVPPALQQQAVRQLRDVGSSNLKNFNNLADSLKDSNYKVRLSGVLNMYKLVKDIRSLRDPAIHQIIPMLHDDEETVRTAAAIALQRLDPIPFIH